MVKEYFVYIMGNARPTLYIGVTNNLVRRVYEHKNNLTEGFTKKYGLKKLLYFEKFYSIGEAVIREKQLKHWNRKWKLELIEQFNPNYDDLFDKLI